MNKNLKKKKGFTLIELIVVIAILGILAAVAIPRLSGIQSSSKVKADAATAQQIINAARIQEADENVSPVKAITSPNAACDATGAAASTYIKTKYISVPSPQSGGTFNLTYNSTTKLYSVTWTSTTVGYAAAQTVTEGSVFTPAES